MFKQLYKRLVQFRPACRRDLYNQNARDAGSQLSLPGCKRCRPCSLVGADVARCSICGPGWLLRESLVPMCPLPTKQTRESLDTSCGSTAKPSSTFDSFPELWAFLTSSLFPDGTKRQTGKMSLSFDSGIWSLVLTDLHTQLYACLNAPSVDDLILMAEARLAESTMPWRASNYGPKGRR